MRNRGSSITCPFRSNNHPSVTISSSSFKCATGSDSMIVPESNSSSSIDCKNRCEGLDLLVKAAIHVAGEQFLEANSFDDKSVVRRRKRNREFRNCSIAEIAFKQGSEEAADDDEEEEKMKKEGAIDVIAKPKRRKRVMALPSKYNDSVLQPWKRRNRARRSVELEGLSG